MVTSNDWEVRVPMSATKQTTKAVEVIPPKTMDLMKKTIGQGQTLNQVYSVLKLKDLEQDISDINQDLEQMEDLVETLEFLANGTSWDKSDMIATSISGVACLAVVLGLAVAITVWRRIRSISILFYYYSLILTTGACPPRARHAIQSVQPDLRLDPPPASIPSGTLPLGGEY